MKKEGFLVFSRKKNQAVRIGPHIKIVVVSGRRVRLAIRAPKRTAVHREEVFLAIQREKAEAEKTEQKE